jgi:hypothetical protein
LKDHADRIIDTENAVILLKSMSGAPSNSGSGTGSGANGNNGNFFDALETLIENLRKECYAKFGDRDEFNHFKKRLEALEQHMDEVDEVTMNNSNSIV